MEGQGPRCRAPAGAGGRMTEGGGEAGLCQPGPNSPTSFIPVCRAVCVE